MLSDVASRLTAFGEHSILWMHAIRHSGAEAKELYAGRRR